LLDVHFQPDVLAGPDQVLFADSCVQVRVVEQKVRQLGALLDEILRRKDGSLLFELFAGYAHHFAKNTPGIMKAERLVKIACN
jgi:hypothetical protein